MPLAKEPYFIIELVLDCNIYSEAETDPESEKDLIRRLEKLKAKDSYYRVKLAGFRFSRGNLDSLSKILADCFMYSSQIPA